MIVTILRTAALASLVLASTAPAIAAAPAPLPAATPKLPNRPLHSEFVVEVNKLGQVVRIESGKSSHDSGFDMITYGNVVQMWIRHPDQTAEAGLFRVLFDYNPKNNQTTRHMVLLHAGGPWAETEGAANQIVDTAAREKNKSREDLNKILGITPAPAPTP